MFTALTLGLSVSNLEAKEKNPVKTSKTNITATVGVTDSSPAKSGVTKIQPTAKPAITAPLLAPSGIMVTGETISWEVLAGGGQFGTSTNFGVLGGFEQNFSAGAPPCCVLPGNASGDDKTNIADVSFVIAWLFTGGADPVCGPADMTC